MDGFDAALARYRAFLASEPIAPLLRRSLALLVPDNIRIDTVTPDDSLRCTTDGTSVTVGGAAYLLRADFDARHWTAALRVLLARELQHDGSSDRDVCAAVRAFSGAYFHEHYALAPELGALLGQRILNILEQARTDNILCRRFPGYLPLLRFVRPSWRRNDRHRWPCRRWRADSTCRTCCWHWRTASRHRKCPG